MEDGKSTGPTAKWWSRPDTGRAAHPEPEARQPEPERLPGPVVDPVSTESARTDGIRTDSIRTDPAPTEPAPVDRAPEDRVPVGPAPVDAASPPKPASATPMTGTDPTPESGPAHPESAVTDSAPGPTAERTGPQPLHPPDPYGTPPYGEPGPWAPAPPVERPVPTPAQGTPVPPRHTASDGRGQATDGEGFAPPPVYPPQALQPHHPHQAPEPGPDFQQHGPAHHGAPHDGSPHQESPYAGAQHPAQGQHQTQGHQWPQPQGGEAPSPQWPRYDPWGVPGAAPLTQPGEPARKKNRRGALLAAALLLALVSGGIGGGVGSYIERNGGIDRIELDQAPRENTDRAPDTVAGIAASALPSVVTLHVGGGGQQGTGTGFVLDRRGHILTNNHVVDPAGASGEISVTFSGGETAKAVLVGKDSGYDLAVVKVSGVSGLTPLPLGNSENVRVGDPVVAIGAPFDLQNTVTSGIISAKERPITAGGEKGDGSDVSYVNALQTDAPINPGNSGGPLVDTKARVIGINSAIRAADTGGGTDRGQSGSIGLGFAIPINQGKRVAEELINTGKATHPVIGVSLDMKYTGDGARVGDENKDGSSSVVPGGPSAKAGIRPGDVITEVDGQRVHSGEELIVRIRSHRPGDQLKLTLVRGGKERTMTLTLGSASGA
ncbi:trypsin-like peptidase domain-containing protein [Streptomyces sp. NPDC004726]